MVLWNTTDFGIRACAFRHRTRRPITRRRPIRRPAPEGLEARSLLSTTYSITDIAVLTSRTAGLTATGDRWVAINNASPAQVVAGEGPDGQAFIWDSVKGLRDLGTLKKEANSASNGINDSGQVVGTSWTTTTTIKKTKWGPVTETNTVENGFLWTASGGMSNLGSNFTAYAINDSGEILGPNQLWNGKTWTSLGSLPGGSFSSALGLNNYGQVVGQTTNNNSTFEEGYLWSPSSPNGVSGSMIDLGSFDKSGPGFSSAAAINGQGSVTGWAENADLSGGAAHAFVWVPSTPNATTGTMVDLGTLAINSYAAISQSQGLAINSSGVVVGDSNPAGSTGLIDATIWQPGAGGTYTLKDLNDLIPSGTGFTLTRADAINDAGLIIVEGMQGDTRHALLLTPQINSAALAAPAAGATPASAQGPIRSPDALSAASIPISDVAPGGPGLGGHSAQPRPPIESPHSRPPSRSSTSPSRTSWRARAPGPRSMAGPRARCGRIPGLLDDRSFPRCKPFQRRYQTLLLQVFKEPKMMHLSNRSCTVNPRAQLARGSMRGSVRFHIEAMEARCLMAAEW